MGEMKTDLQTCTKTDGRNEDRLTDLHKQMIKNGQEGGLGRGEERQGQIGREMNHDARTVSERELIWQVHKEIR